MDAEIDAPELRRVVAAMDGYPHPWAIAGGWALDLFLGHISRLHRDIDVAVCRRDQRELRRHLESWAPRKVVNGTLCEWPTGEWLELPVHEIHAQHPDGALELLLNECADGWWIFRRDQVIRRELGLAVQHRGAVPYLAPEIVLLYKAKSATAVDTADLHAVRRHLSPAAKAWLVQALRECAPGHPWVALLATEAQRGVEAAGESTQFG